MCDPAFSLDRRAPIDSAANLSMSISEIAGAEQLLSRMREAARAAGLGTTVASARTDLGVGAGNFAHDLQRALRQISTMQDSANQQAQAYELGVPGVSLNNVMIDLQKAGLAFQMAVQVRNKLVSAYKEIANMSV
jgi:flagellar hook-basal body complex protein FliE